jgi:sec-independent protein translocase protein TatC
MAILQKRGSSRPPDGAMTIVEHLSELRRRIVICALAITGGAIVAFLLYNHILDFLQQPYCDALPRGQSCTFLVTAPLDGFAIRLQIAGYGGLVIALPVVLWQLWRFITPGLQENEKRYAVPFIIASVVLFILGGMVAFYTFPRALEFLISIGGESLDVRYSPTKYIGLISLMIVAFGASFEFPVLLVFLQLAGVLSSARLRKWRRGAAVFIVAFGAVITPSQDPISLFAMAVPMYVFYEAAILVGRLLKK